MEWRSTGGMPGEPRIIWLPEAPALRANKDAASEAGQPPALFAAGEEVQYPAQALLVLRVQPAVPDIVQIETHALRA